MYLEVEVFRSLVKIFVCG